MKIKCLHEYGISLTEGKIYEGKELTDSKKFIAVLDNTNDWYCFPRNWFKPVEDNDTSTAD